MARLFPQRLLYAQLVTHVTIIIWGACDTILTGMPSLRNLRARPCCYLAADDDWLDGTLEDSPPPEARLAQAIARRLRNARGKRDVRELAAAADLAHATLLKLEAGTSWGLVPTIARLERALDTRLWGDEHRLVSNPRSYLESGEWPSGQLAPRCPAGSPSRSGARAETPDSLHGPRSKTSRRESQRQRPSCPRPLRWYGLG